MLNLIQKSLTNTESDAVFDVLNSAFFLLILLIVLYPLYFIIIASISDPVKVSSGEVWLWPDGFNLDGYKEIFAFKQIWTGYRNSLLYTSVGTLINLALTMSAGYALSRKDMPGRNAMMFLIVFTMFFQGGLIPTYILVNELNLLNTIWAMVLPNAVVAYYLIIVRTYYQSNIPSELLATAQIDGCNDLKFFVMIALPLSLPIIAVMTLFYGITHWNSYFQGMIYLSDQGKYPLQLVLRKVLILNDYMGLMEDPEAFEDKMRKAELIKYGVIIVSSLPLLILYPLLQKYFVKGVMIGSIKG